MMRKIRRMRARLVRYEWLAKRSLALGLVMLAPAAGAAELDVYGRLNVTLQNSDSAAEEQAELKNNASRIGVKGELHASNISST